MVSASSQDVLLYISQERWEKTRTILNWLDATLQQHEATDFKLLESHRGLLVYVSHTYPAMVPYLKGIHLTLDSWRPNRDEDGWKLSHPELGSSWLPSGMAPITVNPVPQLCDDVNALLNLCFSPTTP